MRRVLVGFAVLCLITVTAGVTGSSPAGAVPGFTTVFTANAYSYNDGAIFQSAFCVDGVIVGEPDTEQVTGPYSVASGSHTVDFFDSPEENCTDEDPQATEDFDFPDEGTVTLMGWWGGEGRGVSMLVDPLDCIEDGMGRVTVRNGGDTGGSGAVDVWVDPLDGGLAQTILTNIEVGEQGTVDLPVGTYTDITVVQAGTDTVVTMIDDIDVVANSSAFAYLYGGNDGDVGSFLANPEELDPCTVATTTTAPPAAAPAVEATPAFTG